MLITLPCTWAQNQVTFRQLSVKEGLSQNSAVSITQDSTGYLWIATQDGLNKYDGRNFEVYPFAFEDVTKSTYSVLGKSYTDRQGNLWIIPANRIPHKLALGEHDFKPIAAVENASAIYQDRQFNIWIGTHGDGLYLLDESGKAQQILKPTKSTSAIYTIFQEDEHRLLLATKGKILAVDTEKKTAKKLVLKTVLDEVIDSNFSTMVADHSNRIWLGTFGDGLYFRSQNDAAFYRISDLNFTDPLPDDLNILDLYFDSKQRLWIATYGKGLYMADFKAKSIDHFSAEKHNPRAVHYDDILSIFEDYSGTLWFGTDGAGLSYYDEYLEKFNSLTNYQTPENISIDVVRSIAVDATKAVWIGTSGKGLTQYEPEINSWRTFTTKTASKNAIASNRIMSLWVDQENDLFIGTQGSGLDIRKNSGEFVHYNAATTVPLSAKTIWCIFTDSENRTWLGTREQGLVQFDKKKGELRKFKNKPGQPQTISSNNIRAITEDDKGNLWLATEADGITFFNTKTEQFKHYKKQTASNSLSNNHIKSLYYANKVLWIGTNGQGLDAFDIEKQRFFNYTTETGLANNVIYGILPDQEQNLWLSSNKGITKFTPGQSLAQDPQIINYNNYDGLATEFNTGAHHIDAQGNLYFGGLDGFYWFQPNEIELNVILPKTTITELEVSNEPRLLAAGKQLAHDENTFAFTFSSLQYSLPEKNAYQYKLFNYDVDWVQAGNINFARYSYLPPGDYEFQVKSSNYDGVWNTTPVSYKFSISPPWYATTLAKAVYILLLMALVFGVYRYLTWRWKVKIDLQRKEEEALRLKKRNDFKTKLYTDISHEFRTPLTLISGPIDAKLSQAEISNADFENFSMIKRNTSRLTVLVDQLLQLAKLEKGKLKLKVAQQNLGLFLNMLAHSFEYSAITNDIHYTVHIDDIARAWYDEDAIEKIVTNLLSNAFKYVTEGGECQFNASETAGKLNLSVKNTIAPSSEIEVDKLFTRFYQKDEYTEGAGVGLSLVKELVALCKGTITAAVEEANCIHFKVQLPIEKTAFKSTDIIAQSEFQEKDVTQLTQTSKEKSTKVAFEDNQALPILLIVEDHKEVRRFISSVWQNQYEVFEAANGKEGIAKALEVVPDLIITDVRMPICDGIELCNTLKTDERTSHIPIILLTAGVDEESELKGLKSGADDFMAKPFKLRVLQKRVANLIETRKMLRSRYSKEIVLKAKDIAVTPTDEIFLNRLQKILDAQLANPNFSAAIFCKELGMSRMQLHRKLLAFSGLSTTAFIRSQRLKQALHILKTSDVTVNEVAYAVGFSTPSYFIKCFKEAYNKTPSAYVQHKE